MEGGGAPDFLRHHNVSDPINAFYAIILPDSANLRQSKNLKYEGTQFPRVGYLRQNGNSVLRPKGLFGGPHACPGDPSAEWSQQLGPPGAARGGKMRANFADTYGR